MFKLCLTAVLALFVISATNAFAQAPSRPASVERSTKSEEEKKMELSKRLEQRRNELHESKPAEDKKKAEPKESSKDALKEEKEKKSAS